jgi:type II secretory pathway pseudopilin PulG
MTMKKFTLLELLIVIGILGILVTLLLPSLQRARHKAKVVVCISNSNQINKALSFHLLDNNGKTPDTLYEGHETNGVAPAHGWVGIKTTLNSAYDYRSLNVYLGAENGRSDVELPVAKCPLDNFDNNGQGEDSFFGSEGTSYIGNAREKNWGLNGAANPDGSFNGKLGIFVAGIDASSSKMVSVVEFGGWCRAIPYPEPWSHSWHGKNQYSLGFLDGHVINTKVFSGMKVTDDYSFDRNSTD